MGPNRVRTLRRSFFERPSPVVARDLLGRRLVGSVGGERVAGRIVEAEAYQQDDPAAHSFRGVTQRNRVMFGPAGHLYVYFSYGVHWCMNVVTGRPGEGSAVLLRAAEPIEGLERMKAQRGVSDPRLLCAGPGRLTQALAVTREHNGVDLVGAGAMWLEAGSPVPDGAVAVGPRVGISVAVERPWRFTVQASPFLSRGRPRPVTRGRP